MSLSTKRIHDKQYLYLEAGRHKTLLLGPADSGNPDDFKTENVKQGLEYLFGRATNYIDIYFRLVSLLPRADRELYLSKLQEELSRKEDILRIQARGETPMLRQESEVEESQQYQQIAISPITTSPLREENPKAPAKRKRRKVVRGDEKGN